MTSVEVEVMDEEGQRPGPSTAIAPPWPAPSFRLACPQRTPAAVCARLGSGEEALATNCFEPEVETAEVLTSLLLDCGRGAAQLPHTRCTYIDIGCNVGAFAAQAASLGASVQCVEPARFYVDSIRSTARLNPAFRDRLTAIHAAVVTNAQLAALSKDTPPFRIRDVYQPCDVGTLDLQHARRHRDGEQRLLDAPRLALRPLLLAAPLRRVRLLKIDIDAADGALLHEVVEMLAAGEVSIDAMLVELGDERSAYAACSARRGGKCYRYQSNYSGTALRGGDTRDLWRLRHQLNYQIFRLNVHLAREIYSRGGANVNRRMAAQHPAWEPLFYVRGMRRLERLRANASRFGPYGPAGAEYRTLLGRGQTVLITTALLAESLLGSIAKHHTLDLAFANLGPPGQMAALQAR